MQMFWTKNNTKQYQTQKEKRTIFKTDSKVKGRTIEKHTREKQEGKQNGGQAKRRT